MVKDNMPLRAFCRKSSKPSSPRDNRFSTLEVGGEKNWYRVVDSRHLCSFRVSEWGNYCTFSMMRSLCTISGNDKDNVTLKSLGSFQISPGCMNWSSTGHYYACTHTLNVHCCLLQDRWNIRQDTYIPNGGIKFTL